MIYKLWHYLFSPPPPPAPEPKPEPNRLTKSQAASLLPDTPQVRNALVLYGEGGVRIAATLTVLCPCGQAAAIDLHSATAICAGCNAVYGIVEIRMRAVAARIPSTPAETARVN